MPTFHSIIAILREKLPKQKLFLSFIGITLSITSFILGGIVGRPALAESTPLTFIDEINPGVPYLTIHEYGEKNIVMSTQQHGIRIEQGEEIYNAPPMSTFRLHLSGSGSLVENTEAVQDLNQPCNFIASETGKIAYPAGSNQANRIVHKKCYTSEEAALAAGLRMYEN